MPAESNEMAAIPLQDSGNKFFTVFSRKHKATDFICGKEHLCSAKGETMTAGREIRLIGPRSTG